MKICFVGKNRGKKFLPQIWVFGSFSTGPQLSEYVWVVCGNMKGNCLKSVSKTPTFRFFRDSQPLKRLLHTSSQMDNFGKFLAKMGKTRIFFKKTIGTFFSLLKALINCKVSEKSNERFSSNSVTYVRTYGRTDVNP